VEALKKKERQDETQFTTKIDSFRVSHKSPQPEVISLCFKKTAGTMVLVRCLKKSKINQSSNAG
jgi:hypothetical protein